MFSKACRASAVGIEWLREPTAEEIKADDYMVQRCGESVGWWMGDLIVMLWKREGADLTLTAYAAKYARARGIDEQGAIRYASLAEFFPVLHRCNRPLTWTHHQIVWSLGAGKGLAICVKWLKRAVRGERGKTWSTGRLRSEIAQSQRQRGETQEPAAPSDGDFDEMARMESWSATRIAKLKTIDASEVKEMLKRLESTMAFIDALRARAKESISPRRQQR